VILIPSRAARINSIVSSSSLASDTTAGFRVQGLAFGSEPREGNLRRFRVQGLAFGSEPREGNLRWEGGMLWYASAKFVVLTVEQKLRNGCETHSC
jgi:hypothetical protein